MLRIRAARERARRPTAVLGAMLVCAAVLCAPMSAAADGGGAAIYWGAYVYGAPFDPAALNRFEQITNKPPSIVDWGQAWQRGGTWQTFQTVDFESVRKRGAFPMLTWGSWDSDQGALQTGFRTAAIAAGTYDSYITQWARAARKWGHPFFLRFDPEMNGWWQQYPWADQVNGNQPGDYVRAWQHVHDLFVQQGATNATWVWCPNITGDKTTPLSQMYPGDNYVDWTCMDGYNFGTDSNGNYWQTFAQVFGGSDYGGYNPHNSYQQTLQVAPSKPIMLGEVASAEAGGSKADWITDMLQTLPTNFPQIKAFVWEEWNEGNQAVTWPIDSSAASVSAFQSAISSPVYAGNQFGEVDAPIAALQWQPARLANIPEPPGG